MQHVSLCVKISDTVFDVEYGPHILKSIYLFRQKLKKFMQTIMIFYKLDSKNNESKLAVFVKEIK